jgi:transcriptional regulator with XRE-family HTH domain
MRHIFKLRAKTDGLLQDDIAAALNIDKSLVSKRLNGLENMTLKTLSFMASAMRCRLRIDFQPYESLGYGNNRYPLHHEELKGVPNTGAVPGEPGRPEGLPN